MEKHKTNMLLELIDDIIRVLVNILTLKNTYNKSYWKSVKKKEY